MRNIGFIGVGYMGYGIAKNILKHKNKLFVIANKNRKPIEKIVNDGAEEVKSFEDFADKNLDALFMCVTNTPIAKSISEKISAVSKKGLTAVRPVCQVRRHTFRGRGEGGTTTVKTMSNRFVKLLSVLLVI